MLCTCDVPMSLLLNLVAAQDDAEAVRAATELSADAAEFTLPSAPAAPAAAPAVVPAKSAAGSTANGAASEADATRGLHANGIATENGIDDRHSKATVTANGQMTTSAGKSSSDGPEKSGREGSEAQAKHTKASGAVAKMIQSLESGLKAKGPLPNGLPNGASLGMEEASLKKDPIVVQANGK